MKVKKQGGVKKDLGNLCSMSYTSGVFYLGIQY
jgi:hypothetical protein